MSFTVMNSGGWLREHMIFWRGCLVGNLIVDVASYGSGSMGTGDGLGRQQGVRSAGEDAADHHFECVCVGV